MSRRFRTSAGAVAVLLVAGCQSYVFNPVGHCLVQPGSERVALSSISTADVLFVVDDSGSMAGEQDELAAAFDAFIGNLTSTNRVRADAGLQPIDFHIAVTTSSVYWNLANFDAPQTCRSNCPGALGQRVCCDATGPVRRPRRCSAATDQSCPQGTSCRLDCRRLQGEFHCCSADGSGSIPPSAFTELVPCAREGIACGALETHYQGCTSGIAQSEWPYPRGDFVSFSSAPGTALPNPRVLHFDKELYARDPDGDGVWDPVPPATATNKQSYTSAQLEEWFRQNVRVGACGSGQEQALQAARLAIQKALAAEQRDVRDAGGAGAWSAPTATALNGARAAARWPNPSSKLVVVFVGDEDDCSSPQDPSGGVVMLSERPDQDACSRDATAVPPLGGKQYPVSEFVSFFTGLGRPVAAAFILPAAQTTCSLATCTTAGLCCPTTGCTSTDGAQARGRRLLDTARALSQAGVEVVAGSICDPSFGSLLNEIAEIVKPPQGLTLPSVPAESKITLLRIAGANGATRKICGPALAPGSYANLAAAQNTGEDWWFTATADPGVPVAVSRHVYINPRGRCIANPGETYSADYLGVLPPRTDPADETTGGCSLAQDCADALGGQASQWDCYRPTPTGRGTCTCTGATQ